MTFTNKKRSGLYEHHEIVGSELPVYIHAPEEMYRLEDIPKEKQLAYVIGAYLKHNLESTEYFEPLYVTNK